MKKIIIYTLKCLSIIFLIYGAFSSFYMADGGMLKDILRYFVQPSFNYGMFFAMLLMTVILSTVLYGFAVLLEIQVKNMESLDEIKIAMRECCNDECVCDQSNDSTDIDIVAETVETDPVASIEEIDIIEKKEE